MHVRTRLTSVFAVLGFTACIDAPARSKDILAQSKADGAPEHIELSQDFDVPSGTYTATFTMGARASFMAFTYDFAPESEETMDATFTLTGPTNITRESTYLHEDLAAGEYVLTVATKAAEPFALRIMCDAEDDAPDNACPIVLPQVLPDAETGLRMPILDADGEVLHLAGREATIVVTQVGDYVQLMDRVVAETSASLLSLATPSDFVRDDPNLTLCYFGDASQLPALLHDLAGTALATNYGVVEGSYLINRSTSEVTFKASYTDGQGTAVVGKTDGLTACNGSFF